jgi:hypothetical protein
MLRGVPVPISQADGSVEQILAAAIKVQNRIPEGSTWDGTTDLPMDEGTFRQVISDMQPPEPGATAPGAPGTKGDPALTRPAGSGKRDPTLSKPTEEGEASTDNKRDESRSLHENHN